MRLRALDHFSLQPVMLTSSVTQPGQQTGPKVVFPADGTL